MKRVLFEVRMKGDSPIALKKKFIGLLKSSKLSTKLYRLLKQADDQGLISVVHRYIPFLAPIGVVAKHREVKIIVSLTSFNERMPYITETLTPIFDQTQKPDKIILWLAQSQFPTKEKELPHSLLRLKSRGLEIRWCDDLKPHKKYYFTMLEYPDDIVITIDDDAIYDKTLIETLMACYKKNPNAVSAMRVHKILFDDQGLFRPYNEWLKEYPAELHRARMDLIATGVGGVLYPPKCLHAALFNKEDILQTCLFADDMWLKVMEVLQGTPVALAKEQRPFKYISGTQDFSLFKMNVDENMNDRQLQNICNIYDSKADGFNSIADKIQTSSPVQKLQSRKVPNMPKVSIVLPVYNVEKFLPECLDSVVNQTLKDIEIICVNDGSTDGSLAVLEKYAETDARVKIISKKNSGYGHSMNVGFAAATGEYIGIVETDDWIKSDMYETLYNIAFENDLDVIKADYYNFEGDGEQRKTKYIRIAGKFPQYYGKVLNPADDVTPLYFTMNTWAGIYKRGFIEANQIKHNETPGASYQDSGFWFQTLSSAKRLYFLERPFYMYRQDNPNSSINNKAKVYCVCDEYEFIMDFMNRNPELKKTFIYIYSYRRFYSYMFVLNRIGLQFVFEFLRRFSDDFIKLRDEGAIDQSLFSSNEWKTLHQIMEDPEGYYFANYYLKHRRNNTNENLHPFQQQLEDARRELRDVRRSNSYRVGRLITWLPRMLKKSIRSLKVNGFKYTLKLAAKTVFQKKK